MYGDEPHVCNNHDSYVKYSLDDPGRTVVDDY